MIWILVITLISTGATQQLDFKTQRECDSTAQWVNKQDAGYRAVCRPAERRKLTVHNRSSFIDNQWST